MRTRFPGAPGLRSVPGIGKILSLVILYEVHRIGRFPSAGAFLSYARLISGRGSSAGKPKGVMGRKIGNAHSKWAFSEAAVLMIRESDQAKCFVQRLEAKHPGAPGHALAVLRSRIGRAVNYMLKRKEPFDVGRFFSGVRSCGDAPSSSGACGAEFERRDGAEFERRVRRGDEFPGHDGLLFSDFRRRRGGGRVGEVSRMPTIDFAELRRRVPIARVLELIGFRPLRRSGAELRGPCPIHRVGEPARRDRRSFAANVEKHVFHCFHCGAAGNALDLYAAVHRSNVYRAAIELCERLDIELPERYVRL